MMSVAGVRFAYRSADVLRDVSITLEGGTVAGLVGPNGSGKTTLLKCINGILRPRAGTVGVDAENVLAMTPSRVAQTIGYVPQSGGSHFPSTVFDAVLLGRRPHMRWGPSRRDEEITSRVIRLLGLEDLVMRDIDRLSGGQRQKVLIGRALAQEPRILLLDEPTANLDLKHQVEVMDLIHRLSRKRDLIVLQSVHDLNLASRYCDRILMLKEGRIFAAGGKDVLTPGNIRSVFGIEVKVIRHEGNRIIIPVG